MGFKRKNYEVKRLGTTLPEAYAILDKIRMEKNSIEATFAIQACRDSARNLEPFETVKVYCAWVRNRDIAETVYEAAKTKIVDGVEIKGVFDGWEDDIVIDAEVEK